MKSGYRIVWTDHALEGLNQTFEYLRLNFSDREISRLARKIESVLGTISKFPRLYPASAKAKGVRRAVVTKHNTIYYRINAKRREIEIVSFFMNRRDPEGLTV
jgi:plasmid stabilization system protein ParE